MSQPAAVAAPGAAVNWRRGFIISPVADLVLLIFSPLWALLVGILISDRPMSTEQVSVLGHQNTPTDMFIGAFIFAHLGIVFFRSHGNQAVFKTHPVRFTVVPLALFLGMLQSVWLMVSMSVLATFWDVYHSGMQTFGLGRIYDARAGNAPKQGRVLDMILNQLLYAGPIIGGVTLWDHVSDFEEFKAIDADLWLTMVPYYALSVSRYLTLAVLAFGVPFIAFYLWRYATWARQGYSVSPQKVALLASTGLCSIWTWGFNSFGEAFFIMNLFHAVQYFALVWWAEKKTMERHLRMEGRRGGRTLTLVMFLLLAFAFGAWAEWVPGGSRWAVCLITTVAIMHFWYDGFIWSVRARQV